MAPSPRPTAPIKVSATTPSVVLADVISYGYAVAVVWGTLAFDLQFQLWQGVAIMVLFVFVIMMLNVGESGRAQEREWLRARHWIVPGILAAALLLELLLALRHNPVATSAMEVDPKRVGLALFGPYVLAVEIASLLLLAALVGAYHLGRHFIVRREDQR